MDVIYFSFGWHCCSKIKSDIMCMPLNPYYNVYTTEMWKACRLISKVSFCNRIFFADSVSTAKSGNVEVRKMIKCSISLKECFVSRMKQEVDWSLNLKMLSFYTRLHKYLGLWFSKYTEWFHNHRHKLHLLGSDLSITTNTNSLRTSILSKQ